MKVLQHDQRANDPDDPIRSDPEALIKEARRRTRRRRLRWAAVVVTIAGIGIAVYAVASSRPAGAVASGSTLPAVDIHAFKADGDLAFISRGTLWVLDGDGQRLRRLPTPRGLVPTSPAFSSDGRWLAYELGHGSNSSAPSQLWIAHADGSDPHHVHGLRVDGFVGWSPSHDLVAVTTGKSQHAPYGLPTALEVLSPNGHSRSLPLSTGQPDPSSGPVWSALWAPDGRSLAVSTYSPARTGGTQILDVPLNGHRRAKVWFSIRNTQRLPGGLSCGRFCGNQYGIIAQLAGWWSKWGIGFWIFSSGMTHNSDSTPLAVITHAGGQPRLLAHTLSDGITDAVNVGPDGQLAVVASTPAAGREYALGKTVQNCSPSTLRCTTLPNASTWTGTPLPCHPCFGASPSGAGSAVSLDPAWSADGRRLAYVKAPTYRAGGNPALDWYDAHQLYVWTVNSNTTRRVGSIDGVSLPTWSRGDESILYVSADGLWLTNATTGNTVEIEHPLYPEKTWQRIRSSPLAFFGQIPWNAQFSWSKS